MKNTVQEQQRQTAPVAKPANAPQQPRAEAPAWQLYFIMAVIAIGVLLLAAKVFGIF